MGVIFISDGLLFNPDPNIFHFVPVNSTIQFVIVSHIDVNSPPTYKLPFAVSKVVTYD
ncbi:MAG: hypothetical protein IPP08_10845 [Chlorobiota bacterium]|nr:hypothetical protein [Chlorobiota bacterium]QQS66252.1 MAG: hypothetical protein IPP08_10845 [Chlorobiota bacterium]